jgi:hypothetical protein
LEVNVRSRFAVGVFALLCLVPFLACQTVIVDTGDDVTGPTGTDPDGPDTPGCSAAVKSVRVNPFGYDVPDGVEKPANSSGLLPVGATALVTATPKDQTNKDVPDVVHGPGISWSLVFGGSHVEVTDDPTQPFNKRVRGLSVGEFQLTATVCGVTGAWNGRVIAAS